MKVSLFYKVLHMSVTASLVVVIVLCCRRFLKKAPKIFSYALWGVVLFRLLCPVSIELPFSFLSSSVTENVDLEQITTQHDNNTIATEDIEHSENTSPAIVLNGRTENVVQDTTKAKHSKELGTFQIIFLALSNLWLAGMGVMLLYSVISLIRLKRKLIGIVPYQKSEKIYLSDYIGTPFVIGLLRPRIYLPSSLNDMEMEYVLLHEKHHIYRKDHWIKMLAYVALLLHWFNPFVWIAFILAGKDMEMSCDEAVMKKMGGEICEEYSMLLLRLATGKTRISPIPLAFGEGDTKERIVNVLKWKKTTKWGMFFATILCMVVVVGCAVNGEEKEVAEVSIKKNEIEDVTKEKYFEQGYYKRSDGKWAIEVVGDEIGTIKTMVYQYRIVLHGRIPNAAMDSNFIILSNRKNITFEQAWKASGLSSNSNDYFDPKDAVLVSDWMGHLESQHKEKDEDTIYIIEETNVTVEPFGAKK